MNRSLFGKLGRQLGSRATGIRSGILTLGGFAALTYAAFQWTFIAGWVAVGVSCLIADLYFDKAKS